MVVGVQIIADLYGIDPEMISKTDRVYGIIEDAVRAGMLTKISSDYYQFQPRGVSGIVLLAESHLAFHTWPEHGLVTLDIYTCGDPKGADLSFEYIIEKMRPTNVEFKKITRGNLITEEVRVTPPENMILQ